MFLWFVCTIFIVYFSKFGMTLTDIGETGCMNSPKYYWMLIVENLVKQTWSFCMMLPVGVVLCMLNQYWVFPPLAAIITARRRGMLPTRRCRRSTGISIQQHLSSRAFTKILGRISILVWHSPIHPKYVLWGWSLMILQAAQSWWCCLAEGNQGLPEHGGVLRYQRGSGNCPWNVA